MKIKGYLFTGVAKQLNHTYYSIGEHLYARFYHNLEDGLNKESFEWSPFVYEVELGSEDVYTITYYYLEATKFKLVRTVEFSEIVKVLDISSRTRNELNAILNGTADRNKIIQQYKKLLSKDYSDLSKVEFYRLVAIVSQKYYKLPLIGFSSYGTFRYIRVLEFYNQPHRYALAGDGYSFVVYNKEKFYGSRIFENLSNCTINDLLREYDIRVLLQTRKLSQKKFEEYCEYMFTEERTIFYPSHAVAAGYKILPKYKKHFYPYLIYSDPELAIEIFDGSNYTVTEFNYFYKKNYKISSATDKYVFPNSNIKNIKEIFVKEDKYKYI